MYYNAVRFKGSREFFRVVRGDGRSFRVFPLPELTVDVSTTLTPRLEQGGSHAYTGSVKSSGKMLISAPLCWPRASYKTPSRDKQSMYAVHFRVLSPRPIACATSLDGLRFFYCVIDCPSRNSNTFQFFKVHKSNVSTVYLRDIQVSICFHSSAERLRF